MYKLLAFVCLDYLSIGVAVHNLHPEDSQNGRMVVEQTLESLVNKTSTYEKLHNFVIVILPSQLKEETEHLFVSAIVKKFLYEINIGFLHIVQPAPVLDVGVLIPGSKCNFSDTEDEKYSTATQIIGEEKEWAVESCLQLESMFKVWPYAKSLSENYLHIDDSVAAISNFVGAVREFVRIQKMNSRNWGILEFSKYAFVGNVMRSYDIIKFVQFFATVEMLNMTSNNAFDLFRLLLSQKSRLLRTPEVFERTHLIFEGSKTLVEDNDEIRWLADDPPGIVMTNMNPIGNHIPGLVYGSKSGYFKALMPQVGDWIVIVFDDDIDLQIVKIKTGQESVEIPKHREAVLLHGVIEASPKVLKMDTSRNVVTCADFVRIGDVTNGTAEFANVSKLLWGRKTRCLKLTVTGADGHDIMFRQIAIYS